jgi:oxaloacetate decarboxylase gamma subunit
MTEQVSSAFLISIVGMLTVFAILALVVLTGNSLVRLINRFAPIPTKVKQNPNISTSSSAISTKKIAVIAAAVSAVSNGKGRIEKIEKV